MLTLLNRARRLLGFHDVLLVVAFLAANSFVEVIVGLLEAPASKIIWLVALCAATVGLALREAQRVSRVIPLSSNEFGVWADHRLAERRAAVVVVGLDSDHPEGAMAKLLANAEALEYLVLIGTHETREGHVTDRILTRLLPASGRTIHADHIRVFDHNNAMSVGDYAQAVSEALAWLLRCGVAAPDVVVDITAGRRMAGFGALQAADATHVETQYLAYRWDHTTHRPLADQPAFRVVSPYWTGSGVESGAVPRPVLASSE